MARQHDRYVHVWVALVDRDRVAVRVGSDLVRVRFDVVDEHPLAGGFEAARGGRREQIIEEVTLRLVHTLVSIRRRMNSSVGGERTPHAGA